MEDLELYQHGYLFPKERSFTQEDEWDEKYGEYIAITHFTTVLFEMRKRYPDNKHTNELSPVSTIFKSIEQLSYSSVEQIEENIFSALEGSDNEEDFINKIEELKNAEQEWINKSLKGNSNCNNHNVWEHLLIVAVNFFIQWKIQVQKAEEFYNRELEEFF